VSAISVRGISDFGVKKESDEPWRPVAAGNAAEFVLYTVQSGLLRKG